MIYIILIGIVILILIIKHNHDMQESMQRLIDLSEANKGFSVAILQALYKDAP